MHLSQAVFICHINPFIWFWEAGTSNRQKELEIRSVCLSLDDGNKGFALPSSLPSFMPFFRDIPPLRRECSTAVFADGIRTKKAMNKTTKEKRLISVRPKRPTMEVEEERETGRLELCTICRCRLSSFSSLFPVLQIRWRLLMGMGRVTGRTSYSAAVAARNTLRKARVRT